jgi:hypothetical protein
VVGEWRAARTIGVDAIVMRGEVKSAESRMGSLVKRFTFAQNRRRIVSIEESPPPRSKGALIAHTLAATYGVLAEPTQSRTAAVSSEHGDRAVWRDGAGGAGDRGGAR